MLKENLYNQWIIHTCNEDSLDLLSIDEYYEIEHEPQVENSTLVLFRTTEETVWTSRSIDHLHTFTLLNYIYVLAS